MSWEDAKCRPAESRRDRRIDKEKILFWISLLSVDSCVCREGVELQESEQYAIRARGTSLTIRNIRQGDGGPYTCKASNKAGEVDRQLFLKVFGEEAHSHWW